MMLFTSFLPHKHNLLDMGNILYTINFQGRKLSWYCSIYNYLGGSKRTTLVQLLLREKLGIKLLQIRKWK